MLLIHSHSHSLGIPSRQETQDRHSYLFFLSPFSSMLNEANTSSTISCDGPLGPRQDEEPECDLQLGCQELAPGHHEVEESFL